ncbi:YceI family protein [Plantactinospora solaniradicis]|uniref:YceI family protein n=1 Tax=Plantactinospora solaniradicis TaxID=1723736 RepID=A0ABW1KB19_9ACTN
MNSTGTAGRVRTGTYTLDPAHSRLGFVARHAMVTKVRGGFNAFDGTGHLDADDPTRSTAQVTIEVASVDTRNEQRDAHLRTNDFLDATNHPLITFATTAVQRVDDVHYLVTGDLTIKGITRPITIEFEFNGSAVDTTGAERVGFSGTATINRRDFGVSFNAVLETGGVMVSEQIGLEFDISAVRVPD